MKRRLPIVPIISIATIFLLLNAYAFSVLRTITPIPLLIWVVPLALLIGLIYSIYKLPTSGQTLLFTFTSHATLVYLISLFVFDIISLVNDGYRLIPSTYNLLHQDSFNLIERPLTGVYIGSLLSFVIIIAFIYGILIGKYKYRIIKHILFFEDLPSAFEDFTLVQISDVHAGSLKNKKAVQKGIELIKAQHADLFVFTGDLVNNKAEEIEPYINHFSQIKAPYGQFSVLGNHDYGDYIKWPSEAEKRENLQSLKKHHQDIGFKLLLDEHVKIEKNGEHIILAGVENWGLGFGERGDLQKALQGTTNDEFKILLSHDPTHWEAQVKNHPSKINLTLAGHTHGMQFGIEAFGIKWSPVKYRYKHWAGIKEEDNRILNINRGFGFLGFSGRVGIWPEITVIELKKK
jgi:predicted MPP superfamily phosphohydrolase